MLNFIGGTVLGLYRIDDPACRQPHQRPPKPRSTAQQHDHRRERRGHIQVAIVKLYSLTLPGLDVGSDWRAAHDRLLDDFAEIDDVLPTTMVATLVIVYRGSAQVDGWLNSIDEALLSRRLRSVGHRAAVQRTQIRS
jgi:hypothetical protein